MSYYYFSFSTALFISVVAFATLLPSPTLSTSLAATVTGKDGEFYAHMLIGSPPTPHNLVLDTDTDLIWTDHCNKSSTSYSGLPCNSDLCNKTKGGCDKTKNLCHYKYKSTNRSTFPVDLATETFTFEHRVKVPNLAFTCAALENGTGGLGLGHGPLSLISQTKATNFSYCLPAYDDQNKKGFVLVGSRVKSYPKMITTSLVKNPPMKPTPYYIRVDGMSINNKRLPIDASAFEINGADGSGGFTMDTGSTMTYLNKKIFDQVRKELVSQISLKRINPVDVVDLPLCFDTTPASSKDNKPFVFPNITIHFSPTSQLTLSLENSFREYIDKSRNRNVSCLAMTVAPPADRGMSSLGNIQQQNTVVVFDLAEQTVGFLPESKCDTM